MYGVTRSRAILLWRQDERQNGTGGEGMSEQALSIVGSSRRNGERELNDFYPTPTHAVEALIEREPFVGTTWEPACGDGAIVKVMQDRGMDCFFSDLVYRGFGNNNQIDFLKTNMKCENIITNPPFVLAQEFIEHAKECASHKIAMFLKTTFLEGKRRYPMFMDKDFPLATVYQFCKRVRLDKNGINTGCKSGMIAFAWFVWDKEHSGSPIIKWI